MRGVIITVSFIMLLLLSGCSSKEATSGEGVEIVVGPEDAENATTEAPASADQDAAEDVTDVSEETPQEELSEMKCDEKETFGFLGCSGLPSGDAELTIRNSGRVGLEGAHIRYFNRDYEVVASSTHMFDLAVGSDKNLALKNSEHNPKRIEVFPVRDGSICINKQLVIIPVTNCR